jgi:hypothetical protein
VDKQQAIQVQNAIRDAVSNVLRAHSLIITTNRASYTPTSIRVTLELSLTDAQGVDQAAKTTWEKYAHLVGLPADAFGKVFRVFDGTEFRISGLSLKCPRFPVSAVRVQTNRSFKFPAEDVAHHLSRQL